MRKVERLNALRLKHLANGLHPDVANLFLQVGSKEARSWIFRYKRHGRSRDMGLGRLHDVTLVEARRATQEARATLRAGRTRSKRSAPPEPSRKLRTFAGGHSRNWNAGKGFGFVRRDDRQPDIFVHINNVIEDVETLSVGD